VEVGAWFNKQLKKSHGDVPEFRYIVINVLLVKLIIISVLVGRQELNTNGKQTNESPFYFLTQKLVCDSIKAIIGR
jgi:hypothetical protein